MKVKRIKESSSPSQDVSNLLVRLHRDGPVGSEILEELSCYKEFHSKCFADYEEQIISAIGLFYKVKDPQSLYSFLLSRIGVQHKEEFGATLTPVQASVRRAIDNNRYVSISAPTSAGKSFSIRDFIADQQGDAVVIVPSRALIAEYVNVMRRRFDGDKNVMISPFVDSVFTSRDLRRIFVLTPERARDLFSFGGKLDLRVFFFDEAQVSEEKARGVVFDVLVRRVHEAFPTAKLIFAHPFVDNPDAQFKKHGFSALEGYSRSYTQGAVGKICVFRHSTNGKDYYYSPFEDRGHVISGCVEFDQGFEDFAFNGTHSILIYVSKASIYNGNFLKGFENYINSFPDVEEPGALEIINAVAHMVGADKSEHRSRMIALLRKGVVIHHGSVPLEVRFLVEDFIRGRHAKICFATSTLAQGVNMPFDIVWLENMRFMGDGDNDKSLAFKNLIGRAGRLSDACEFDYGYVYTKNPKLFSDRIRDKFELSDVSMIDAPIDESLVDSVELIESMRDGTFDDEFHLPGSKVTRLTQPSVMDSAVRILDLIYGGGRSIKDSLYGAERKSARDEIKKNFKIIFEASLNRALYDGEVAVFETAISIFLQAIQGVSFREIVGMRYSRIARRDEGGFGNAAFSQPASKLPNSLLKKTYPLFPEMPARAVSYDAIVFDTYDYMDQVISFCLSDVFMASFKLCSIHRGDKRADKMVELLRFGTNDAMQMLLMRYGFSPEEVAEITPYVQSISESNVVFKKSVDFAPGYIQKIVEWYRP